MPLFAFWPSLWILILHTMQLISTLTGKLIFPKIMPHDPWVPFSSFSDSTVLWFLGCEKDLQQTILGYMRVHNSFLVLSDRLETKDRQSCGLHLRSLPKRKCTENELNECERMSSLYGPIFTLRSIFRPTNCQSEKCTPWCNSIISMVFLVRFN